MKKSLFIVAMSVAIAMGATAEVKIVKPIGLGTSKISVPYAAVNSFQQNGLLLEYPASEVVKSELTKPFKVGSTSSVLYDIPDGVYYLSPDIEFSSYQGANLIAAPYMNYTWKNLSTAEGDVNWEYSVGDNTTDYESSTYYSSDRDLTFAYDDMVYSSTPTLTIGDLDWNFALKVVDNNSGEVVGTSGAVASFGLPMWNGDMFGLTSMPFTGYTRITGRGSDGSTFYWFGDGGVVNAGITGLGLAFSAPAAPYYLETAYTFALDPVLANGARLTMTLYDFSDGTKGDVIATGYATANDIQAIGQNQNGETLSSIEFKFYDEDELGGMTQIALYVDSAVYAEISGFGTTDASVPSFALFYDGDQDGSELEMYVKNCGYVSSGEELIPVNGFFTTELYSAPIICFNMVMGAFVWDVDADMLAFGVDGGSQQVAFKSQFPVSDLMFFEEYPEWVTVAYADENDMYVTVTVDPLTEGTGRTAVLDFGTVYGGRDQLVIQQGEAGVEGVEVSANRVSVVNGNFEVEAASATSVDVYNVAGQKVASAAIEGTTVVPAQDLAKGLYILKFNDNTAVKVMK